MSEEVRDAKKARTEDAEDVSDPWKHQCEDVISFHILEATTVEGLEQEFDKGGKDCSAEFFHQQFGDDHVIKGYLDLRIKFWMSATTYHTYVQITYTKKKISADKIIPKLNEDFPKGIFTNKAEFIAAVVEASDDMAELDWSATKLALPQHHKKVAGKPAWMLLPNQPDVSIHRFKLIDAPQAIRDMHARFEPYMFFYIDGFSLLQTWMDEKWEGLFAVRHRPGQAPVVMGLVTLYNYWAYPDKTRQRLSQILVMPPYRDLGLGKCLMACSYQLAVDKDVVDMTIEDPTDNLMRVREKLEVEQLLAAPWVQEQAKACAEAWAAGRTEWPTLQHTSVQLKQKAPWPLIVPWDTHNGNANLVTAAAQNGSAMPRPSDGGASAIMNASVGQPQSQDGRQDEANTAHASSAMTNVETKGSNVSSPSGAMNNGVAAATSVTDKHTTTCMDVDGEVVGADGKRSKRQPSALECLRPHASFLALLTQEFKIITKEARMIWESMLYLQPAMWSKPGGQEVLTQLIRARLQAAKFQDCASDMVHKAVLTTAPAHQKNKKDVADYCFIMARVKPQLGPDGLPVGPEALQPAAVQPAAGEAGPSSSTAAATAATSGTVMQGRHTKTEVSAEDSEREMKELIQDRWQQLQTLKTLLHRKGNPLHATSRVAAGSTVAGMDTA